jgi:hypothetical protein
MGAIAAVLVWRPWSAGAVEESLPIAAPDAVVAPAPSPEPSPEPTGVVEPVEVAPATTVSVVQCSI